MVESSSDCGNEGRGKTAVGEVELRCETVVGRTTVRAAMHEEGLQIEAVVQEGKKERLRLAGKRDIGQKGE